MVWDPLTGRRLGQYEGVDQVLTSEGLKLWLTTADHRLEVVDLPPSGQALIDQARSRGGTLSAADRARFFLQASR